MQKPCLIPQDRFRFRLWDNRIRRGDKTKGDKIRMKKRIIMFLSVLCMTSMLGGCGLLPFAEDLPFSGKGSTTAEKTEQEQTKEEEKAETTAAPVEKPKATPTPTPVPETPLEQAERMAVQYDYDGAINLLKSQPDYETNEELKTAVSGYEATKATCVEYPLEQITHVFYHTLIKDASKAFDGDSDEGGYNQYMTTIDEFNKITQIMYEKGYVLVSPHDMATVNEDGTMSRGKILLPPGKIPFVLSQDDVSYYHYMNGDGFASKLVLNKEGEVKCQYIEDDGSVSVGDYDMVPLLDTFIKEHPDFSYHGRKGILAMTGYNGVLGYRTDIAYKTREKLQTDQQEFLDANPDFDYEKEVKQAKKVAKVMRENGWEFASHTWGHRNVSELSAEELQVDDQRWKENVEPILGKTDMIIFAFGADIGDWQGYSADNPKFAYYKSQGYNYYCNVDSNQYWVQITDNYFRQGRRNLDGYRMYYNPEMLSDLFDVSAVWDASRPTPVPEM